MLRLWSVQHPSVADDLSSGRLHRVLWERVAAADLPAFRAMAEAMNSHGIITADAPVWAWKGEPDEATVHDVCQALLSEADWSHSPHILTLDVPAELVLFTDYSRWQDDYLCTDSEPDWSWLFAGADDTADEQRASSPRQATLPLLHPSWLVRAEPLPRRG